jgi:hypothetical protein
MHPGYESVDNPSITLFHERVNGDPILLSYDYAENVEFKEVVRVGI